MSPWPITIDDVTDARRRIAPFMAPSPVYTYPLLDEWVGHGIRVFVKHENFNPTNAFKVRNALSFMTARHIADLVRGVVAATRGNHGLGLAWAGRELGAEVTVCVPLGNNPDKNAGMRALGATVIESGRDYDEAAQVAQRLAEERGEILAHSTNNAHIIAGAATMTLEMIEQAPELDAVVLSVGGGSQAVGAMVVARALRPSLAVYGVQAAGASATHDSWHAGRRLTTPSADTFADGLATRSTYDMTFEALREGLADFVTATDAETADALRAILRTTHSLTEGAGAAGLAGLRKLAPRLAGKRVGIAISGGNIDEATLLKVLTRAV